MKIINRDKTGNGVDLKTVTLITSKFAGLEEDLKNIEKEIQKWANEKR